MWLAVGILAALSLVLAVQLSLAQDARDKYIAVAIRLVDAGHDWKRQSDEFSALARESVETLRGAVEEVERLRALVSAHHAVGAMDGALIGDTCPVCAPPDAVGDLEGGDHPAFTDGLSRSPREGQQRRP